MQLAMDLVNRRKTKDQLIDEGFHRDTFADKDGLPAWFLDDEMRNFRKHVPVTKEAVQALRDRLRALNARPIKKIAEAKGRKKLRALRRMEKMQNQANTVNEAGDMTEREKAGAIEKMLNKASKNPKQRKEVKVIVAKGVNKGNKGRPRGVKGRYKVRSTPRLPLCRCLRPRGRWSTRVARRSCGPRSEGSARKSPSAGSPFVRRRLAFRNSMLVAPSPKHLSHAGPGEAGDEAAADAAEVAQDRGRGHAARPFPFRVAVLRGSSALVGREAARDAQSR